MCDLGFTGEFAVTVTLSQYSRKAYKTADDQFDQTQSQLRLQLGLGHKQTWCAEFHKDYVIHYHGIVQLNMVRVPMKYHKDFARYIVERFRLNKLFGFVTVKIVESFGGWVDYLKKDWVKTYLVINRWPVVQDDHGINPEGAFIVCTEDEILPLKDGDNIIGSAASDTFLKRQKQNQELNQLPERHA